MTLRFRFGGYQGDTSVHSRAARVFCAALERDLPGADIALSQNIVTDGHKASDLLAMTETGALEGCYFSSSYLADRVPELAVFDLHFAVVGRDRAYEMLDGALGARLAAEVEAATGFAVLGFWDNGLRHISTVDRAILAPGDCAGLRLRTLASDDHQRVFRALGFEPVAVDVRDLPEAVRRAEIAAQENPLTNIWNFGLHETHRVITLTAHLLGVALLLVNREAMRSWSPRTQAAVRAAAAEATAAQRRFAVEDDAACAAALRAAGVRPVTPTAAQRAGLAAAVAGEVARTRARFPDDLVRLMEGAAAHPAPSETAT